MKRETVLHHAVHSLDINPLCMLAYQCNTNWCQLNILFSYNIPFSSAVTIQFEQPTFTVDEQSARIRIPLIASRASSLSHLVTVVGTSVTALLSADDINADAAISFEGPGQNILLGLSPGQTTLDIPVDIFEDDLVEGDEEFTLTLTPFDDSFDDFSNFDFSVPNLITTLTVTISDNDVCK